LYYALKNRSNTIWFIK